MAMTDPGGLWWSQWTWRALPCGGRRSRLATLSESIGRLEREWCIRAGGQVLAGGETTCMAPATWCGRARCCKVL